MQLRFARAFTLSCACAAAAAALRFPIELAWGWEGGFGTGVGRVFGFALLNAIVVLVLHTPLLLGLKWATRNRVKLSPWVWGALGLTIPLVAELAFSGPDATTWMNFGLLARALLDPEMRRHVSWVLTFGSLIPTMMGGAAFVVGFSLSGADAT